MILNHCFCFIELLNISICFCLFHYVLICHCLSLEIKNLNIFQIASAGVCCDAINKIALYIFSLWVDIYINITCNSIVKFEMTQALIIVVLEDTCPSATVVPTTISSAAFLCSRYMKSTQ